MSSVEFRIEVYHHDSDNSKNWSFGCPELNLMGYSNLNELFDSCVEKIERFKGRTPCYKCKKSIRYSEGRERWICDSCREWRKGNGDKL